MDTAGKPISAPLGEAVGEDLKPGTTLLQGQYRIERFLGAGGFALTYLARDSLERPIVVKECFPGTLCVRKDQAVRARSRSRMEELSNIVRLFFREAQRLSKLEHPNIVGVHQVFEDNNTAYMALDYIEGPDLMDVIDDRRAALSEDEIRLLLSKLLDAISYVHEQNILHRDISPDNIILDNPERPVLIDFGAAREQATRASRVLSALQVVKDGYSPQEFYVAGAKQGPEGDLYALGATFYHLITGEAPPNSQIRLSAIAAKEPDPYRPLVGNFDGYDKIFLGAIDKALNVFPRERHQTAQEWIYCLDETRRREAAIARARRDSTIEKAISELVSETNKAVLRDLERASKKPGRDKNKDRKKKEKKPFFPWQTEEDWVNRETEEQSGQPSGPVEGPAADGSTDGASLSASAAPKPRRVSLERKDPATRSRPNGGQAAREPGFVFDRRIEGPEDLHFLRRRETGPGAAETNDAAIERSVHQLIEDQPDGTGPKRAERPKQRGIFASLNLVIKSRLLHNDHAPRNTIERKAE